MAFDFTALVALARRTTQKVFGTTGNYDHPSIPEPVELSVRWHNRLVVQGDLVEAGYGNIIDGVNRLIFSREQLVELGLVLQQSGRVSLSDPLYAGAVLILDSKEPHVGPVEEIWNVVKE
jgi:hypothetical protein